MVMFSPNTGANLFSLIFKPFQGNKIASHHFNNNVVESSNCVIILDHHFKTHYDWVAGVEFHHEKSQERAQYAMAHKKLLIAYMFD